MCATAGTLLRQQAPIPERISFPIIQVSKRNGGQGWIGAVMCAAACCRVKPRDMCSHACACLILVARCTHLFGSYDAWRQAKEISRLAPCAHLWLPALFIERAKHLHKPHRAFSLLRARVLFLSRTQSRFLTRSLAFLLSRSLAPSFFLSLSLSLSHIHTHILGAITLILMHSDSD